MKSKILLVGLLSGVISLNGDSLTNPSGFSQQSICSMVAASVANGFKFIKTSESPSSYCSTYIARNAIPDSQCDYEKLERECVAKINESSNKKNAL